MIQGFSTVAIMATLFILLSCSPQTELNQTDKPSKLKSKADYKLVETFNTGQNVFVRSLSVDKTGKLLWVGTSVGAIKVSLVTGDAVDTFTRENGLANEYIFAVMADTKNRI